MAEASPPEMHPTMLECAGLAPGEAPQVRPGSRLVAGRYALEHEIGSGGMGRVFRVRHCRLGKVFALKIMHQRFTADDRERQRFFEEARLASSLSHPKIVPVVDFGDDAALGAFMVMELLDGESLASRLRAERRLPLSITCDLLLQIGHALAYMHRRGVVHGDVKPSNILLGQPQPHDRRRWHVRLVDFGLARSLRQVPDGKPWIDGTPEYMAPERVRGAPPQPATDIYALGVLAYELLAGRPPFEGSVTRVLDAHLTSAPRPLAEAADGGLDPRVDAFVLRALAKDPAERYLDVPSFVGELRELMDRLGLGRRGRSSGLQAAIPLPTDGRAHAAGDAFDWAPVPLAGCAADGTVVVANRAFAELVTGEAAAGIEGVNLAYSPLAGLIPDVVADLRRAHMNGVPFLRVVPGPGPDAARARYVVAIGPAAPPCDVIIAIQAVTE